MSSPRPSPPSKVFTKHDPQPSLSWGLTGFRRASKTNGRILPQSPSCCRHRCGFQAAEDEHDDNGDNIDDDNIYFKAVFQSNSLHYKIGSNGWYTQSSYNISGSSHQGFFLLLALVEVIDQVSSFKNFCKE